MATASETKTYTIDPAHSSVSFSVRHLVISKVRGHFNVVSGTVQIGDHAIPTSIEAEIDVSSVDTRDEQRDGHLKSPDFFHVEQHPKMTFKSTSITAKDDTHFTVVGDLTLRGTTKSISLDGEVGGRTTDPWGNDRIGYEATGKLDRQEFGVSFNSTLETGGLMVGNDVDIMLEIEVVPAK